MSSLVLVVTMIGFSIIEEFFRFNSTMLVKHIMSPGQSSAQIIIFYLLICPALPVRADVHTIQCPVIVLLRSSIVLV